MASTKSPDRTSTWLRSKKKSVAEQGRRGQGEGAMMAEVEAEVWDEFRGELI
jgi:hypothetical protein